MERSRYELIRDILLVLKREHRPKKTRIMQRAYVDWRGFNLYFGLLVGEGFVSKCDGEGGYVLTERGHELLKRLKHVSEVLDFGRIPCASACARARSTPPFPV